MEIREILIKNEFRFKKSLGQNFITDSTLLDGIVRDSGITSEDVVLEIGTGAGTLTRAIAKIARKVVTFDIDMSLQPILQETLAELDNIQVIFRDIMKLSDDEILNYTGGQFKIVANIPYNITTPLIMRFAESNLPIVSATFMVQQEIADRLTAEAGSSEYGSITISLALKGEVKILRKVNKHVFFPVPKVDSAVVFILFNSSRYEFKDEKTLKRLIRSGFHMRRKTFTNNITSAFPEISKETINNLLKSLGFNEDVRGEDLTVEDYIKVSDAIFSLVGETIKEKNDEDNLYEDDMFFEEEYGSTEEEESEKGKQIDIIDYEK